MRILIVNRKFNRTRLIINGKEKKKLIKYNQRSEKLCNIA